jgi:hypothetical protein
MAELDKDSKAKSEILKVAPQRLTSGVRSLHVRSVSVSPSVAYRNVNAESPSNSIRAAQERGSAQLGEGTRHTSPRIVSSLPASRNIAHVVMQHWPTRLPGSVADVKMQRPVPHLRSVSGPC